jgi:crossover junction endodeoxyribonuclease RuvC
MSKETSVKLTCPLSNKKRILGLDLSLTGTGWSLWGSEYNHDEGLINTDKLEGLDRMDHILKDIQNLIDIKNKPAGEILVILEDFSFASKGSSVFQIAGLGHIIRHWLWTQSIDFILIPPTVLKKFVTGAGNSDKSVMLKEVYKRWGYDTNDDNIGDAYSLGRMGRAMLEWDTELVGFQKDALKQLNKEDK